MYFSKLQLALPQIQRCPASISMTFSYQSVLLPSSNSIIKINDEKKKTRKPLRSNRSR